MAGVPSVALRSRQFGPRHKEEEVEIMQTQQRTRHKRRYSRPPMTPEQARTFNSVSLANAALIMHSLECDCSPYEDVFTLRRWNAQGFKVKRGQHGIHIPVVYERQTVDPETGEETTAWADQRHRSRWCRYTLGRAQPARLCIS